MSLEHDRRNNGGCDELEYIKSRNESQDREWWADHNTNVLLMSSSRQGSKLAGGNRNKKTFDELFLILSFVKNATFLFCSELLHVTKPRVILICCSTWEIEVWI